MTIYFLTLSDGAGRNAGESIEAAIKAFDREGRPQSINGRYWHYGWVVGKDTREASQVYVVVESQAERVTATSGSKASEDAMIDVLRSRGWTCIKRGAGNG